MNQKPERWSKSVIMPDMWFDSDQDPREAGDDPVGERATCERYLRDYRLTIELKCQGLNAAQMASRPVPPSTLSLLGLLRHLGEVERDWRNWITAGEPAGRIYCPAGSDFETVRPDPAQVSQALRIMHEEQDATDRLLAGFEDLGQRAGREQVVIRDLMVHRIEEYARHSGHADLLRECFDGRVGQ